MLVVNNTPCHADLECQQVGSLRVDAHGHVERFVGGHPVAVLQADGQAEIDITQRRVQVGRPKVGPGRYLSRQFMRCHSAQDVPGKGMGRK